MCSVLRDLQRLDTFADSAALRDPQVAVILKVEPKLRGQSEVLPQANGGVGADSPVSASGDAYSARL